MRERLYRKHIWLRLAPMRMTFFRLHLWLHKRRPLGWSWPAWICEFLNRLGYRLCVRPPDSSTRTEP